MYKYILFDLDGTLTDSAPGIMACIRYACEKMGIKCPTTQLSVPLSALRLWI